MSEAAEKLPFRLLTEGQCVVVQLDESDENILALAFSQTLLSMLQKNRAHVIIACPPALRFSQAFVRSLLQVRQTVVSFSKQIRLVGLTAAKVEMLKQQGLEHALKNCATIKDAIAELNEVKAPVLDAQFIEPFLLAPGKVLELQAQTVSKPGKPFRKDPREKLAGDISGVIGLVADAFTGSVVISFPKDTFLKVMSRMLGEEFTELTPDIQDGAGELTNIIFGQAKVVLNEKGYNIQTALPQVVVGSDHAVVSNSRGPRIVVPFTSDAGPFFIEVCLSA